MKHSVLLLALAAFFSCSHAPDNVTGASNDIQLTPLEKKVVASDNRFGLKLFDHISNAEQGKNVFISPLSVSMALGMTLNGARSATLDSMKTALEHAGYTMDEINASYKNITASLMNLDPDVKFQIANSIWYRKSFPVRQEFTNVCGTFFDAEVSALDFSTAQAVTTINDWVNEKTYGKIPTILDSIDPADVMFLINAIYFKGTWTYRFEPEMTSDAPFTTASGTSVQCRLMRQHDTFAYHSDESVQVIDLPYASGAFSMTVVLPRAGVSIDSLASTLSQEQWDGYVNALDSAEVYLYLPKFTLRYEKTLNDDLTNMGMGIAFTEAADFTGIAPMGLCISYVKHKTFVQVDEEGTEAAAVTIVGIRTTSVSETVMRIDRPFLFAIREHGSGTILFIGKIVDPTQ